MALDPFFVQQVKTANQGKIKARKPRKWLYPSSAERIYQRILRAIVRELWKIFEADLFPAIPAMVEEAKQLRPDSKEKRIDSSWVDQLDEIILKTSVGFDAIFTDSRKKALSKEQAERISGYNKSQFVKVIHSAVRVNPIINEVWLEPKIKEFQNQNSALITKLTKEQTERVNQTLYRNLSTGNGISVIRKELAKDKNFGKKRANLIARDQTNKFNSQLSQLRQRDLGIEEYVWTTSRDERVRSSHSALDGKKFKWNKPPAIGHAGEPIQCRCIAQPIIDEKSFGDYEEKPVKNAPEFSPNDYKIKSKISHFRYKSELSKNEIDSIKEYQGEKITGNKSGGYTNIQSYLRTGKIITEGIKAKDVSLAINNLDSSIAKGAFLKEKVVYRGIREGNNFANMKIGEEFSDKAFTSTARKIGTARKFAPVWNRTDVPVIFKINVKKGQNGIFVGDFAKGFSEGEILLPRNQKFKIISKKKIDDYRMEIEVDAI